MSVEMVLTAIAQDRPGLVEALAEVVAGNSGNWIDSSMARLGGEFAGIVRISVPETHAEEMERALHRLEQDAGIAITVCRNRAVREPEGRHAQLELIGQDQTGIVLEVTRVLAAKGVNVDELNTSVFAGGTTGTPMFSARANVMLPPGAEMHDLREALEEIAQDLMVEIELKRGGGEG